MVWFAVLPTLGRPQASVLSHTNGCLCGFTDAERAEGGPKHTKKPGVAAGLMEKGQREREPLEVPGAGRRGIGSPRRPGQEFNRAVRYLTAPLITPLMTHFWAKTYTMSTGAIAIR